MPPAFVSEYLQTETQKKIYSICLVNAHSAKRLLSTTCVFPRSLAAHHILIENKILL